MKKLSIDIESYSDVDLTKSGVYSYAQSFNAELLLFGYSVDGGDIKVIDVAQGEKIPTEILQALSNEKIEKWCFNANFERVFLSSWLSRNYPQYFYSYITNGDTVRDYLNPRGWKCSLVWSAYMGLPLSLKSVGEALKLSEQKMDEGKDLIKYFCVSCKPTKANGGRTRNLPIHAPDKWKTFKAYNKRDVEVEMAIQHKLHNFPVPDFIWEEFYLDQEINDRGIMLDMPVVKNAIDFDERIREQLTLRMQQLTELENPNSVQQMKSWLRENGMLVDSLGKKEVKELLKTAPPQLAEVLMLRQQLAKSSVKKYTAMQNAVCADGRARGMFQFYGANRSGRWSGRLIQLQNLPQNHISDLNSTRELVKQGNFEAFQILYDNIPETLSELIRTAFIPKPGYKFIVADFSAIEARVLSWVAKEKWRMDTFANGGDIYCATASRMFHCNVVKHGENGHLRQKGKSAELACGYSGSVGALKAMGALESGMTEDELQPLVDAWRAANPNIVQLWRDIDTAVKNAVKQRTTTETHGLRFIYQSGMLFIELPSKRRLAYVKPQIGTNRFGGESVTYMGIGGTKKWERIESFGAKFVENIVQAISRDILMYSMNTLRKYRIVATVHDEIIIECPNDTSLDYICKQMSITPPWAEGLILNADGYECQFYKKD